MSAISTIDLTDWRAGGQAARTLIDQVDAGLQRAGFLLVQGHGVSARLAADVRRASRRFFALPVEIKQRYSARVGERGWQAPGVEASAHSEGTQTPPDLKESFAVGAQTMTGEPAVDRLWFTPNVWPDEVAELEPLLTEYTTAMTHLAEELVAVCATALRLPQTTFASVADRPTWSCNVNHYPPMTAIGRPAPGQFRIGPHTDFGMVTILDREPGSGGLQVYTREHGWQDAPFDPTALTVNIGDLLAYWTGHRWTSGRHRVLPPQPDAPEEDLVSLVYFYDLNHDAQITPLPAPIGRGEVSQTVISGAYLKSKLDSISVA
jgi:isopenicillin N synthase-like dioxygenase